MRNGLGGAAPENAELAFSGGFAATDETDFKLIRYIRAKAFAQFAIFLRKTLIRSLPESRLR